ncbi:MAG: DUF4388 domain-containing protein [Acidobacteria bacterium]|nr:DUF4388 domain-containing protein [Acidobacteriota bacterium]
MTNLAYRASLTESPLPEVLSRIAHYGVPGAIHCTNESSRVTILTEDGEIVFATPQEDPVEFLIGLLKSEGYPANELEKARKEFEASGRSIGATLIAKGVATPVDLLPIVRRNVDQVIAGAFEWTEGTVEFKPGKARPPIRLAIPIRRQILDAVRYVRDLKPLLARIGPRTTVMEHTNYAPEVDLQKGERAVFVAADGRRNLEQLVALPPLKPGENGRIIYGLFAVGLIRPKSSQVRVKLKV